MRISKLILSVFLWLPLVAFSDQMPGIGGFAESMMEPTTVLAQFVITASLVIGAFFLFAAFVKYMQYRVNPLATPISTVIFLVIFGVLLLCLPLAQKYFYDTPPIPALVK